jgi:hypothetical protein
MFDKDNYSIERVFLFRFFGSWQALGRKFFYSIIFSTKAQPVYLYEHKQIP